MTYPMGAIFRSLQGEGAHVGVPMTFLRLAGCGVQKCLIRAECDEAPWKMRARLTVDAIIAHVAALAPTGIVNITGGEPLDYDLVPLCERLHAAGYRIHLETSGTVLVASPHFDWVTVSPKAWDYVQRIGQTLKIVVRPEWGWAEIRRLDDGTAFQRRFLQPLTVDGVPVNLFDVMAMVLDTTNNPTGRWALSTQAHRTWSIR